MTKAEAIARLRATQDLSTGMLKPFGIPFEAWLKYCQASDDDQLRAVAYLLRLHEEQVTS